MVLWVSPHGEPSPTGVGMHVLLLCHESGVQGCSEQQQGICACQQCTWFGGSCMSASHGQVLVTTQGNISHKELP